MALLSLIAMFDRPFGRGVALAEFAVYCVYVAWVWRSVRSSQSLERFHKLAKATAVNVIILSTVVAYVFAWISPLLLLAARSVGLVALTMVMVRARWFQHGKSQFGEDKEGRHGWQVMFLILSLAVLANTYVLATATSPIYSPWLVLDVALLVGAWTFLPWVAHRIRSASVFMGIKYGLIFLSASFGVGAFFLITREMFYIEWYVNQWFKPLVWLWMPANSMSDLILRVLEIPSFYDPTPRREQVIIHSVGLASSVVWGFAVGFVIAYAKTMFLRAWASARAK